MLLNCASVESLMLKWNSLGSDPSTCLKSEIIITNQYIILILILVFYLILPA